MLVLSNADLSHTAIAKNTIILRASGSLCLRAPRINTKSWPQLLGCGQRCVFIFLFKVDDMSKLTSRSVPLIQIHVSKKVEDEQSFHRYKKKVGNDHEEVM